MEYKLLEPNITQSVGGTDASFSTTATPSFFSSTSFLYTLAFVIIVVTASFRYAYAGMLRIQATEKGIKDSKEEFKRVTYGLLGVFGLWLVLFTINKDMLTGDVNLDQFKAEKVNTGGSLTQNPIVSGGTGSGGSSKSCDSEATVKAALTSSAGICGGISCGLTSCISNNQYKAMLQSEDPTNWKIALVIMCKESNGDKNAQHKNDNNTWDCGLMQKNMPLGKTCADDNILDPLTNIRAGLSVLRNTINANNQTYPGVPSVAGVFSAYNCCGNGTPPNAPSSSCTSANGWPSVPKWVCPIDPGQGSFNMCSVKSYACELTACLNSI